jgi:hypothetical protein
VDHNTHPADSVAARRQKPIPRRQTVAQLQALAKAQESDIARFRSTKTDAERQIAAINPDLKPGLIAERTADIRAKAGDVLRELLDGMKQRDTTADGQRRHWEPTAVRRIAASEMDAAASLALQGRLARVPLEDLRDFAELAVADQHVGLAGLIEEELGSRHRGDTGISSVHVAEIRTVLSQLAITGKAEADAAIGTVRALTTEAELGLLDAASIHGKADPAQRLKAFRARQGA